jgi:ribosomal protein S4
MLIRRRLPIVMVRLKMAETVREAVTFVEQVQYTVVEVRECKLKCTGACQGGPRNCI